MSPDTFVRREVPRLSGATDARERERARRQGHALGFAEGLRDAAASAHREAERAEEARRVALADQLAVVDAARAALVRAAAAASERTDELVDVAQQRVWTLAVELAEALLDTELSDAVRSAHTAAGRAVRAAAGEADPVLVLSTRDLATLRACGGLPDGFAVEASDALSPGDALVRLPEGRIDLRLDAALRRVRDTLAEVSA